MNNNSAPLPASSSSASPRSNLHACDVATVSNTISLVNPATSTTAQMEEGATQLLFNLTHKDAQNDKPRIQEFQFKNLYEIAPCQPTLSQQLNAINSRINRTLATPSSSSISSSLSTSIVLNGTDVTPKPLFASPTNATPRMTPLRANNSNNTSIRTPLAQLPFQQHSQQKKQHKPVARHLYMEDFVETNTNEEDRSLQAVRLLRQTEERKSLLSQAEELLRRTNMAGLPHISNNNQENIPNGSSVRRITAELTEADQLRFTKQQKAIEASKHLQDQSNTQVGVLTR